MKYHFMFILVLVISDVVLTREYCAHEYFNPQCRDDEVIVMEKATYGRMESGRCIKIQIDSSKSDVKYFGCKADVLELLDRKCSGRQKCSMMVMDQILMERSTCYEELVHYLEADYFCQPVVRMDSTCSVGLHGNPIHLLAGVKSGDKKQEKCGGSSNPLTFEASVGQSITVSVVMFHQPNTTLEAESYEDPRRQIVHGRCATQTKVAGTHVLGTITESSERFPKIPFCSFHGRQMQVMKSQTNKIQVEINFDIEARFLLVLEATGCYDLKPPQDAWMKREGNEITVGCYMNRHTWKLFCNGRNWVGVIGNCTQLNEPLQLDANDQISSHNDSLSQRTQNVFIVLVLVCLLLLTLTLVSCVILYCCQRRNPFQKTKNLYLENGNCSFKVANVNPLLNQLAKEANIEEFTAQKKDIDGSSDPCYYVLEGQTDND